MRLLFVSCYFPYPPTDGNILPAYHFLRLTAPQLPTTVLTPDPDDAELVAAARAAYAPFGVTLELVSTRRATGWAQLLRCLRAGQVWMNKFYSPELAAAVRRKLAQGGYDLLHAEGVMSAQHVPRHPGLPLILAARDCLALGHWRRFRAGHSVRELLQAAKIAGLERGLLRRFDRILAISPVDRAAMLRLAPGACVELLPNGVDLENFRPRAEIAEEPGLVVFNGAMAAPANADAALYLARDIWPRVRATMAKARLRIIGSCAPPELAGLAAADPSIQVAGFVPEIAPELARAAVIASPLRFGTGIKNKVLEGAAMGKALVVTRVSLEGIALEPDRELLLADDPPAFAAALVRLLRDAPLRARLGAAARACIARDYSWETSAARLLGYYRQTAAEFSPGKPSACAS
jgi:glycosyltransferase involved in cell wall biosynthesis